MAFSLKRTLGAHQAAIASVEALESTLMAVIQRIGECLSAGGTVFVCGNGGSAADAQHFAAELTGRYVKERRGLASIALTTDTSALTAIANDYGFKRVFSRQLEALANSNDVLIVISTSGNSANLIEAVMVASERSIHTVGLLGGDGGELGRQVDLKLTIRVNEVARIQEAHMLMLHMICEAIDDQF